MRPKIILLAIAVVAVSFFISLKAMDWFSPRVSSTRPVVANLPPLPPAPRSSVILAQITIPVTAIRDAADRGTPRTFAGKADNPVSQVLQNADIGWTASRGPVGVTGGQDVLSLTTALNGKLNVTGSLAAKTTGAVGDAIGSLLGSDVGNKIGAINIKAVNASAEIKGNVIITARPKFAAAWRIEPNLTGQVSLGDTSLSVAGARVNVPAQIKPVIDKNVADQITAAGNRIRNDRVIRAQCPHSMGQGLPFDTAASRKRNGAVALARTAADARGRGAAECQRHGGDDDTSASRRKPASRQNKPRRCVRSPTSFRWCRRPSRSSASESPLIYRLPMSTRSWKRSSSGTAFPRTVRVRLLSP